MTGVAARRVAIPPPPQNSNHTPLSATTLGDLSTEGLWVSCDVCPPRYLVCGLYGASINGDGLVHMKRIIQRLTYECKYYIMVNDDECNRVRARRKDPIGQGDPGPGETYEC